MATADRLAWRTSTYTSNGADCVDVAPGARAVLVRDTKDRGLGPILLVSHATWAEFRSAAQARRIGTAGELTITRGDECTWHSGTEVRTSWHVTAGDRTLHFTESEWVAFAAGARDGEFDFATA